MEVGVRGCSQMIIANFRFLLNLFGEAFYLDHEQIQAAAVRALVRMEKMNKNSELNALVVNRLLDHFSSFQIKENMGSVAIGQRLKLSCNFFCQPFLQTEFLFPKARNADETNPRYIIVICVAKTFLVAKLDGLFKGNPKALELRQGFRVLKEKANNRQKSE